jgi:hypothetical protein
LREFVMRGLCRVEKRYRKFHTRFGGCAQGGWFAARVLSAD